MSTPDLYRPSNGTEGEWFLSEFCLQCQRDAAFWDDDAEGDADGCRIAALVLIHDPDDPEYPREWTYDAKGNPVCTAFVPLGGQVPTEAELEAAGQLNLLEMAGKE